MARKMHSFNIAEYEIFLRDLLGRGTFCDVYRGKNTKTTDLVAAKRLAPSTDGDLERLRKQMALLKMFNHRNVVKFRALFEDIGESKSHWIIMELCDGGNLEDYLRANSPDLREQVDMMYQCAAGLAYLHTAHDPPVVHRDVKPSNILISISNAKPVLKLADFDLAAALSHDVMFDTFCGTPYAMAPELLLMRGQYGTSADVFSCGITFYYILTKTFLLINNQGKADRWTDVSTIMEMYFQEVISLNNIKEFLILMIKYFNFVTVLKSCCFSVTHCGS